MLEQYVRGHYQYYLVDPISKWIADYLTPNQVTIAAGLLGITVPFMLFFQKIWPAIVLLLLSGYLDTVDGTIARNKASSSDLGSLLDILMDRLVEFSVIFGLWIVAPTERAPLCLLMLGSILLCVTSFLTVGIFSENHSNKSFHYSPGIIERPEAFIFFVLMMLFGDYFFLLSMLFIILVCMTTIIRVYEFYRGS